jgi:alpha-1,3-mannosyltransferase
MNFMRILHITSSFWPAVGGLENYVMNLCRHLIDRGHCCDVLTIRRTTDAGSLMNECDRYNDINIKRIHSHGTERCKIFPPLFKFTVGYDLLHIHDLTSFCGYFAAGKRLHKKLLVVSTHGGFFHTSKFHTLKNIYYKAVLPSIFRRIDKVIAVSNHDYEIFRPICPNIITIPNGIDFSFFSKVIKDIENNSLLYFGRISQNKRLDNLIDTICCLRETIPNIHLYIIGQDWEHLQSSLMQRIDSKGANKNVFFLGQVTDDILLDYLAKARFFVTASQYEGFGLTVLEAMASGTIPIVNDIDPLNSFIHDQHNGFIVNFSQPKQAASKISDIIKMNSLQHSAISAEAKEFARSFAWENVVQNVESVYNDILSDSSAYKERTSPLLPSYSGKL